MTAGADEAADEIVGSFAKLYPRLALPHEVWQTLHEMIEREFDGRWDADINACARDLAQDDLYIKAAEMAGLR